MREGAVSRLGAGFIGCGRIMDLNVLGYLDRDDVEIVALCDLEEEVMDRTVEQYGPASKYFDHLEMLQDPSVDIAEVLTPHYLHRQMVVDALSAGKHVSLQKPPAVTMEEMDDMLKVPPVIMYEDGRITKSDGMRQD